MPQSKSISHRTPVARFLSVARYLAYSAVKILAALLFWGVLGYVTQAWTGQGGFPVGHLVFLSWSVLLSLLCDSIYHSRDAHLEDPVHGSIALLFGVLMATTIWLGAVGAQDLHTAVHFLARPHNFPGLLANPAGHLPQIFFHIVLYFIIPTVAGMLTGRVGIDIEEDIAYHHDLLSRRKEEKE